MNKSSLYTPWDRRIKQKPRQLSGKNESRISQAGKDIRAAQLAVEGERNARRQY
ncbi:MAG: hypothetical protein GXZ09_07275 [Syntrophomonadaceae bacterium]|nr:hypothetical protein [Syntrophomonadaceae bacterium]